MSPRSKPGKKAKKQPSPKTPKVKAAKPDPIKEAERLAAMLAEAPAEGVDPLAPPSFITDPRLQPALITWRDLAPKLDQRGCLTKVDRQVFALFCYYRGEFIEAVDDILKRGYSMLVPTIAKGKDGKTGEMYRTNPSVDRRDNAASMMLDLSKRFGLTPLDRYTLFRTEKNSADPGLFDDPQAKGTQAKPDEEQSGDAPKPDKWAERIDARLN